MMGPIIKLKKSKRSNIGFFVILVAALFAAGADRAMAQGTKLPVIQQVGVIPVQWDKQTEDSFQLEQSRRLYQEAVFKAARDARRFRILNEDLMAGMWSDHKGRQELEKNFELHAYLSIGSQNRGETIDMTARMLDANLKTLLLETDTFSTAWFMQAGKDALTDKAEELVFRIFNRIPVDVSVTSIQGQYITLSGGMEQGIEPGDSVELVRTHVDGLHPANGSWLSFKKRPVGKARVIDVKKFSSVARLTQLVKDSAVEVGDGARIPAIATRVKFARQSSGPEIVDKGPASTIVVPPMYTSQPAPSAPQDAQPTTPASPPSKAAPGSKLAENDEQQTTEESAPREQPGKESAQPEEDNGPSVWKTVSKDVTSHKFMDHITVYSGPYWWSVKGPTNASGRFPVWILNSLGASVSRTLLFKIKTDFGGGGVFGNTPHANYLGYNAFANMYWEDDVMMMNGLIRKWRGGGFASFSGMSVPKGPYGGGDWIRGGGFIGLLGSFAINPGENYDWYLDYTILPLNIGRTGYSGKQYNVESSFGMKFAFGAFQSQQSNPLSYGGEIEIGDERMTLSNGRRPHYQDWHLKLMARYKM
jgi:hypothetical protein